VGGLSGIPGYYEAVTHSGVTLGPLVGRLLAREILAGDVDPLIAPFRPDRFAQTRTRPSGQ
jgi:glycine/D-amino acid oxidase-like deaminating enzyme